MGLLHRLSIGPLHRKIIASLIVLVVLCVVTIIWLLFRLDKYIERSEQQVFPSIIQQYQYDTIVTHSSPFQMIEDTVNIAPIGTQVYMRPIFNYIIAVTTSDSCLTDVAIQQQVKFIHAQAKSKILAQNTQYKRITVIYWDRFRDTTFTYAFKVI